jgi:hypothetical protein
MLVSLLPTKAANTLIMENSKQIASQLTYLQDQKSLTFIEAHFQNVAVTMPISLLPTKAADTLLMDNSEQHTFQLTYKHYTKLLTLC